MFWVNSMKPTVSYGNYLFGVGAGGIPKGYPHLGVSARAGVYLSLCPSSCLSIYMSVYMSAYVYVCCLITFLFLRARECV